MGGKIGWDQNYPSLIFQGILFQDITFKEYKTYFKVFYNAGIYNNEITVDYRFVAGFTPC